MEEILYCRNVFGEIMILDTLSDLSSVWAELKLPDMRPVRLGACRGGNEVFRIQEFGIRA
jgi:hypothetical protein